MTGISGGLCDRKRGFVTYVRWQENGEVREKKYSGHVMRENIVNRLARAGVASDVTFYFYRPGSDTPRIVRCCI